MLSWSNCRYLNQLHTRQLARLVTPWCHGHLQFRTQHTAHRKVTSISVSNPVIEPPTAVEEAVRAVCASLGRTIGLQEEQLIKRLRDNWYDTAQSVARMTQEDLEALQVPLRLHKQLQHLLEQHSSPQSQPDDASTAAWDQPALIDLSTSTSSLHPDIMSRQAPRIRQGRGTAQLAKTTTRTRLPPYTIKPAQMNPTLQQQMSQFHSFCTTKFFGQQVDPVTAKTASNYSYAVRGILGWLHNVRGVPLDELTFQTAFPSSERLGVVVTFEYMQWLTSERSANLRTQQIALHGLMHAAKFTYHSDSKVQPQHGATPYSDLELVQELRAMLRQFKSAAKVTPHAADVSRKWLDWPEYMQLVQQLRLECAGLDAQGRPRPALQVAASLQRYLMFAILACVPDRQRTLRELRLGSTLVQDQQGRWVIKHGPGDYKTGKVYGERPPLVISPHIYPELEAWIHTWRGHMQPQHDFLFTRPNGQPYNEAELSRAFSLAAYRLTGKRTTPHLVRDMIVTYLRGSDASERQLEALAIYMGHSVKMQRESYDRRSKAQKVEPAVELLQLLNGSAGAAPDGVDGSSNHGKAGVAGRRKRSSSSRGSAGD